MRPAGLQVGRWVVPALAISTILGVPRVHAGQAARWPAGTDSLKYNRERIAPRFPGTERAIRLLNSTYSEYTLEFRDHFVRVTESHEGVGEILRVIRKPVAVEAVLRRTSADLTINEMFGWFLGVSGNYLFIEASSNPCPCGLIVYDLSTGKKILDDTYLDVVPPTLKRGRWLTYREDVGETTDLAELMPGVPCPDAAEWVRSLGIGYDEEVVVDLKTLQKVRTGKFRCGPRQ